MGVPHPFSPPVALSAGIHIIDVLPTSEAMIVDDNSFPELLETRTNVMHVDTELSTSAARNASKVQSPGNKVTFASPPSPGTSTALVLAFATACVTALIDSDGESIPDLEERSHEMDANTLSVNSATTFDGRPENLVVVARSSVPPPDSSRVTSATANSNGNEGYGSQVTTSNSDGNNNNTTTHRMAPSIPSISRFSRRISQEKS